MEFKNKVQMWRLALEERNANLSIMQVFDSMLVFMGEQQREIERLKYWETDGKKEIAWHQNKSKSIEQEFQKLNTPKPIEEWGEEDGDCLWWFFPIVEPPYCGTPLDADFPDYVTHFTSFLVPNEIINKR